MGLILHLTPVDHYNSFAPGAPYFPTDYDREGFIHCTQGSGLMLQVANKFYRGVPGGFQVLILDADRITAPVKWEPAGSSLFPHIYGPLNRDAVIDIVALIRAADGEFIGYERAIEEG